MNSRRKMRGWMDGWAIDLTRRSWKNFGRKRINRSLFSRIRKKQRSNRRREIGREEHSQFKHRTHTKVSQPNAWPCARTLRDGLSAPNEADKLICLSVSLTAGGRTDERGGKEYPPIRRMPEEEGKRRRRRRRRVGKPRCEFLPLRPTSVSVAIWTREQEEEDEEALLAHCRPCRRRTARINNAFAAVVPRRP